LYLGVLVSIYHLFLPMLDEQNRLLDSSSVAATRLLNHTGIYSVALLSVGERVIDFSRATTLTVWLRGFLSVHRALFARHFLPLTLQGPRREISKAIGKDPSPEQANPEPALPLGCRYQGVPLTLQVPLQELWKAIQKDQSPQQEEQEPGLCLFGCLQLVEGSRIFLAH
jgi:hypothetical protein